jgi:outer membrane protein OmpA-like peptidoglycan-associated protein
MRRQAIIAGLAAVALVAGTGCVTKKRFRTNAESVDGRIASVESGVEAAERRINDIKDDTDDKISALEDQTEEALRTGKSAATAASDAKAVADRAEKGRLLWSVSLTNDQVRFGLERAALGDEGKAVLDDLVMKIKNYGKAVYIEIEGHTDSSGDEAYNMMLGEKRAMAVRDYLSMSGGIPLHAMNTISYGESQPVADNGTREGRSQNRRVVVRVLE